MTSQLSRIALSLLLPAVVQAQNLVQNADFDTNLTGWVPGGGGSAALNTTLGSPSPDSAELTAGEGVIETLTQCVVLPSTLASSVSLSANVYVFSDSTNNTGNGYVLQTSAYAGATCSDATFYGGNSILLAIPTTTWTAVSNNYYALPGGFQSMLLSIRVAGNLYYADYAFDHFSLTQVTDRIFATGFEINEGFQN